MTGLVLLVAGCGGGDPSIAASEAAARFQGFLRSEYGVRGVQVECSDGNGAEASRPGARVFRCTVTDPVCESASEYPENCVDGLGEWNGTVALDCWRRDPDLYSGTARCAFFHEAAFNDGARGGFDFKAS